MSIRKGHTVVATSTGAVKDQNKKQPISFWTGTLAEYEALGEWDENTLYNITDDTAGVYNFATLDLDNLTQNGINVIKSATGMGLKMFDTICKDYLLPFEESKGLALQGTYVYKEPVTGSRYGYPDFYNKCLEEATDPNNTYDIINHNYEVVGNPTISENGIASGFSSNDFITVSNTFLTADSWKIVYPISRTQTIQTGILSIQDDTCMQIVYTPDTKTINYALSSTGTSWDIANSSFVCSALNSNNDSLFVLEFTGTSYEMFFIQDGVKLTGTTITDSNKLYPSLNNLLLGGNRDASTLTNGVIDLTKFSITLNDSEVYSAIDILVTNKNGHKFYPISSKAFIDTKLEQQGSAWYYGIDEINERVYLPRNNYFEQVTGDVSEVGLGVNAGLPNITGTTSLNNNAGFSNPNTTGAFTVSEETESNQLTGSSKTTNRLGFDASKSNDIYGNSDTVQPNAVKKLLYICVGITESSGNADITILDTTTTENDTVPLGYSVYQQNIQPNISWLKSEGQWNSGNTYTTFYNEFVSKLGQEFSAGYVKLHTEEYSDYDLVINQEEVTFRLPLLNGTESVMSSKYDTLTLLPSESTYVAPANGWFYFNKVVGTNEATWVNLINLNSDMYVGKMGKQATDTHFEIIQVAKGDVVKVVYNITGATNAFRFYYAQGSGSLYFKVANAVQNLELIDAGRMLDGLADKIGRKDCKAYITEIYHEGTSWYRVWSDGFIEQGGRVSVVNNSTGTQVLLLKQMSNTNYTVTGVQLNLGGGYNIGVGSLTTTSFNMRANSNASVGNASWCVSGY